MARFRTLRQATARRRGDAFVADHLNASGQLNPRNLPFTKGQIGAARIAHDLASHRQRRGNPEPTLTRTTDLSRVT